MPSAGGPPEYDFSAGGPADYGAATGPGSPGDPSPSPEGPSAGYAPHGYPATAGATPPGSSDAAVGAAPDQDHAIDPSPPQPRQAPGPAGAVSASATVPAANRISAERGEAPPVPSSPRVYGTPIPQEEVDAPLPTRSPRQRPPGQPVYSDLLGPPPDAPRPERGGAAPAAGASLFTPPREKPVQPPAPGGQMFTQRQEAPPRGYDPSLAAPPGPRPPAPDTRAYPATGGAQPPVQGDSGFHRGGHGALAPPPGQPGPAGPPGPGQPGQHGPGWHPPSPPGGGPAPTPPGSAPPDGEQTARSALPIAVIVGAALGAAALVVGVALGIPALLKATQDDPYAVGNCVVRQGDTPVAADCTQPGAYEIVVQVGALEECPEWPDQHAIEDTDTGDVYCLEPVAEPTTEQTPPADVNTPAEQ